jgi:hypothetical protein
MFVPLIIATVDIYLRKQAAELVKDNETTAAGNRRAKAHGAALCASEEKMSSM